MIGPLQRRDVRDRERRPLSLLLEHHHASVRKGLAGRATCRHEIAMSVPGPRSSPVGSQTPKGKILKPLAGVGTGKVRMTGAAGVPVITKDAGITSTSPRGLAVEPSLLLRKVWVA